MKPTFFHTLILVAVLSLAATGCSGVPERTPEKARETTIDSFIQDISQRTLFQAMDSLGATSGEVLVLECRTGYIRARAALCHTDDQWEINEPVADLSGLMRPATVLASLMHSEVKLSDPVDVGNGCLKYKGGVLHDHNWHRRGYGKISYLNGVASHSNIAIFKLAEQAFHGRSDSLYEAVRRTGFGLPDSIPGMAFGMADIRNTVDDDGTPNGKLRAPLGTQLFIHPVQIAAFYNAVACNGRMVAPSMYKDSVQVLVPAIAPVNRVSDIQIALQHAVTVGLSKPARPANCLAAGYSSTLRQGNVPYRIEFCGYFPTSNPKYTIYVGMTKPGLPASGSLMPSRVFKQLADRLVQEHYRNNYYQQIHAKPWE